MSVESHSLASLKPVNLGPQIWFEDVPDGVTVAVVSVFSDERLSFLAGKKKNKRKRTCRHFSLIGTFL